MNINDLICPQCTLIFKFDIVNYKESYINHILVHLTDLSNERDNLTKILTDGGYNTFNNQMDNDKIQKTHMQMLVNEYQNNLKKTLIIINENDELKKNIAKLLENT